MVGYDPKEQVIYLAVIVGAFAAALAQGIDPVEAARFGSAAAGISVTRRGTAPAMPRFAEIEGLLKEPAAP